LDHIADVHSSSWEYSECNCASKLNLIYNHEFTDLVFSWILSAWDEIGLPKNSTVLKYLPVLLLYKSISFVTCTRLFYTFFWLHWLCIDYISSVLIYVDFIELYRWWAWFNFSISMGSGKKDMNSIEYLHALELRLFRTIPSICNALHAYCDKSLRRGETSWKNHFSVLYVDISVVADH